MGLKEGCGKIKDYLPPKEQKIQTALLGGGAGAPQPARCKFLSVKGKVLAVALDNIKNICNNIFILMIRKELCLKKIHVFRQRKNLAPTVEMAGCCL